VPIIPGAGNTAEFSYTLQNLYDDLVARGDLDPGWDMAGYTVRPILTIANTVMQAICGGEGMFPWKWNQFNLPVFYWNSWQQDYALLNPNGTSVNNLAWLQEGIAIDINNPSEPKPWSWIRVGRNQSRSTGAYISNSAFVQPLCGANFLANNQLYYGTWGAGQTGNGTYGNNPQAGQTITNPLGSNMPMPNNPILQIKDANGNLLVLTGYGVEGSAAPVAGPNAAPGTQVFGTGASTLWTVVDPFGQGIRLAPVPSQTGTVWQMNLVGQMKPTKFVASTALAKQSLYPLTDEFYPHFLDGCTAQCYRYGKSTSAKQNFDKAFKLWFQSIVAMRREADRERDTNKIRPSRSIVGAGGASTANLGPFWPFNYPVS
jgi:hypothetical protein